MSYGVEGHTGASGSVVSSDSMDDSVRPLDNSSNRSHPRNQPGTNESTDTFQFSIPGFIDGASHLILLIYVRSSIGNKPLYMNKIQYVY